MRACRYLVVLHMGGVYTDSDVECRKPLDELIQLWDGLVAGWEAESSNATITQISEYARKRQVWPLPQSLQSLLLAETC